MAKKEKESKITGLPAPSDDLEITKAIAEPNTANQDSEMLLEAFGRIAALEQRLEGLEETVQKLTLPATGSSAVLKNDWGNTVVANPQAQEVDRFAVESKRPSGPEAVARNMESIANSRAEAAAKIAAAKGTAFAPERLAQLAAELEGENISSVQPRLTGLQQVGKVVDFRILKLGSVRPLDEKDNRILVTTDSVGLVVRAEVG